MKPEGILRGGRPLSLYLQCGAGADEKERTVFVWNSYSETCPVKNVRYYEKDRNFERKPARRARRRSSRRSRAARRRRAAGSRFFPEWHEYPRLPRVLRWRQGSCKSLCPEGRHAEDLPRLSRDGHCRTRYALMLLDDTCIQAWEIHLIAPH